MSSAPTSAQGSDRAMVHASSEVTFQMSHEPLPRGQGPRCFMLLSRATQDSSGAPVASRERVESLCLVQVDRLEVLRARAARDVIPDRVRPTLDHACNIDETIAIGWSVLQVPTLSHVLFQLLFPSLHGRVRCSSMRSPHPPVSIAILQIYASQLKIRPNAVIHVGPPKSRRTMKYSQEVVLELRSLLQDEVFLVSLLFATLPEAHPSHELRPSIAFPPLQLGILLERQAFSYSSLSAVRLS